MPWKKSGPMEQRMEFALRAMRTLNFRALCQQYGISTKTGYKWRERFWRKGLAGMEEESRRPKSHSEQLPEEEGCEIVRLKLAHFAWGRARSGSCICVGMERWPVKVRSRECWRERAWRKSGGGGALLRRVV